MTETKKNVKKTTPPKPKPKIECNYCKGGKKPVKKGCQSGGCGCAAITAP
jgi:hypothetical protein